MTSLLDAIRAAGGLTALPVDSQSPIASMLEVAVAAIPATPTDVKVKGPRFTGDLPDVTVTADHLNAHLDIPVANATLTVGTPAGDVTLTGTGASHLELDIGQAGIRSTLAGDATLTVAPSTFTVAGGGGVTIAVKDVSATMRVEDGEIVIDLKASLEVEGIPTLDTFSIPFDITCDRRGLTTSLADHLGPIDYAFSWTGLDPLPASIDLSVPFAAPGAGVVPGVDVEQGTARIRLRAARTAVGFDTSVSIEGGDGGILSSSDPHAAALGVLSAATVGSTAAAAEAGTAEIVALVTSAALFADNLHSAGSVVVTRVELDPPDHAYVDYHADLSCRVDAGPIAAHTTEPMRVAVRRARLGFGAAPTLSFKNATIDVADTGRWQVDRPDGVLQIADVRSGHGSSWFELDLRVALDLGPLKVAGAVVRISLQPVDVVLQGFSVDVDVPGLISGGGSLSFAPNGDFAAALRLDVTPINVTAAAGLVVDHGDDHGRTYRSILASLGVDLPAPLPLANTGIGLFGIQGLVGLRRDAKLGGGSLEERLAWRPDEAHTRPDPNDELFGAAIVFGTLPDLGFAFSALGRVVVTVPDVAVRAAVEASLLAPHASVVDDPSAGAGPNIRGTVIVDPSHEVYAGVIGSYQFPPKAGWTLLDIEVPVEARYPVPNPSQWFIHIGTDGQRGGLGPVRARVLPDLFDVGAEAYLMLHGDGFDPNVDSLPSPKGGFAAAAGFRFSTMYGTPPVWADISIAADALVSSRPLFVAAHAMASGGLHLGPFSLGLSAEIKLQVGPGDVRYASLEACGSVDLFFFSLSGCIHISFGDSTDPKPLPPESPFVGATVADVEGMHHGLTSANLTTGPAGAPAMWPDGTVHVGFNPAPKFVGPAGQPFHDALSQTSGSHGPGSLAATDGTLGVPCPHPATWTLTGLTLDEMDGANWTPVAGPLSAAWQIPPAQKPVAGPSARVLSLFTDNPALWSLALTDGAVSDAADPVAIQKTCCEPAWSASPGWAVGSPAQWTGPGAWRLPSALRAIPRTTESVVTAETRTVMPAIAPLGRAPADAAYAGWLPTGVFLLLGGPSGGPPVDTDDGRFDGWLPLPDIAIADRKEPIVTATTNVHLDDVLVSSARAGVQPTIIVAIKGSPNAVRIVSNGGLAWKLAGQSPGPSGTTVGIFIWEDASDIGDAQIMHPVNRATSAVPDAHVYLIAVGGVTRSAADAADAANGAASAATKGGRAKAKDPAPDAGPLKEGHTYRISATWHAELVEDTTIASGETELLHFRIADHGDAQPAPEELYRACDTFHPAMLGRYVAGYGPDRRLPWFTGDELTATLSTRSAKCVAKTYGYRIVLDVTRTDPPPAAPKDDPEDRWLVLGPRFTRSTRVDVMRPVDRRGVIALDDACGWPHDAVDLSGDGGLKPRAHYDLAVALDPIDKDPAGQPKLPNREYTKLVPRSFTTSRWSSPSELFRALGFGGGPAVIHARCGSEIAAPTDDCDGALHQALQVAGATVDPLADDGRATVLWLLDATGSLVVAGALIECVEPMVRSARLGNLSMAGFSVHMDGGTTRALFIPTALVARKELVIGWGEHYDEGSKVWGGLGSATLLLPDPSTVPALTGEIMP